MELDIFERRLEAELNLKDIIGEELNKWLMEGTMMVNFYIKENYKEGRLTKDIACYIASHADTMLDGDKSLLECEKLRINAMRVKGNNKKAIKDRRRNGYIKNRIENDYWIWWDKKDDMVRLGKFRELYDRWSRKYI